MDDGKYLNIIIMSNVNQIFIYEVIIAKLILIIIIIQLTNF
jgi:hypothetical protein